MSEIVFLVEEEPGGGFTARALGESIFTQAETFEALRDEVRDAVRCHFNAGEGPGLIQLHYVRDEVLAA
ncbi:MAG: 2-oxoisovalerate dehydrogenase E1 subunit beta [Lysobacterales bacterium]